MRQRCDPAAARLRQPRLLLLALLLPAAQLASAAAPAGVAELSPFHYLKGQLIDLDSGVAKYRLAGLQPNTSYEVRLSFPASIPATIRFELVDGSAAAPAGARATFRRAPRRLLDCEKLIFSTDAQGAVQGFAQPLLLVTAARRSVHRDGPKAGASKLVYNIVLVELLHHLLPKDVVPTVVAVVLAVVGAFAWSLYWSSRLFPRLLLWITSPASDASAARLSKRHS